MNIVIASDSFKESLSSFEVGNAIKKGILKILPQTDIEIVPVADGGEGTVEAVVKATHGRIVPVEVYDPLLRKITAFFGVTGDGLTAVIEMAAASGLPLLKPEERNPLVTSSFGTGELIAAAIEYGCRTIIIGLGGSATNDGGIGMMKALGAVFNNDPDFIPKGGDLGRIQSINLENFKHKTNSVQFLIASDVTNPLTGTDGATRIFSAQKGADERSMEFLEKNMVHYAGLMKTITGRSISDIPGSGAAGGMGAALLAFMNAELRPGFSVISELIHLDDKISKTDLVITGEGKLDHQTRFGKTPSGVATIAKKFGKPVIAVAGTLGEKWET
ncbi:MAG: glycerate kinase, partial [Bacteroidales bacterium]|nr:glycerate kinase [Bacteroidales bacterium]